MRNMLIVFAALASVTLASNVMAASPNTVKAPSVLVESASDISSVATSHTANRVQTMVHTEMEQPVVIEGQTNVPQPQAVHRHHNHNYHKPAPRKKQSMFDKLMDLERRKNAWLKKKFLGR